MKTKTKWMATAILGCLLIGLQPKLFAQTDSAIANNSPNGGAEKMLLAGEAFTLWQSNHVASYNGSPEVKSNTFGADPLGLMLMPLIRINDRLFLDAQVAVFANPGVGAGGGASANLNEAIIYYRVAPSLYLFTGYVPIRTGLYEGILDDFTNRFCSGPIGMGIVAAPQPAVGIQGGIQCGYSKLNYQLYVSNGPRLIVDSSGAANGQMDYSNFTDNNINKAVGGSLGFLPFSNSELEIGVSGQYTPKTGDAGSLYENVTNTAIAAYLNYYHNFGKLMVRVQGQYEMNQTQTYNFRRVGMADTALPGFGFTNQATGWYGGLTFRLAGSQNKFLSNLELGARMSNLTPPKDAFWGGEQINQMTFCLTYWFTWKCPINIAYDIYTQNNAPQVSTLTVRGMWFF